MSFETLPFVDSTDNQINIRFVDETIMATVNVQDGRRLKAGDTAPDLTVELRDEEDKIREIPDSATVIFGARKRDFDSSTDSTEFLTSGYSQDFDNYAEGYVVNSTDGLVAFDWSDADTTEQVGKYDTEFVLQWTDGDGDSNVEFFPSDGFTEVTISESLQS